MSRNDKGEDLYIGLMSGTSIDAIDSAIVKYQDGKITLVATREHSIPGKTRDRIAKISETGDDEIERLGRLDKELGILFGEATLALLQQAKLAAHDIAAIGSHGQTIRHRPPSGLTHPDQSFTLQIGDPNTIAEQTGITTVADFRRRDIAAGGEGAPLAPGFHAAVFAQPGINRAIVNIGGIANASILRGTDLIAGYDTGPGNTLLDNWILKQRGTPYDKSGNWAAEGLVSEPLLQILLSHPYFTKTGPRSTGKEAFNLDWLDQCLSTLPKMEARDIQATLAELTAASIVKGIANSGIEIEEVYICGGGAHNTDLMRRLYNELTPVVLDSTIAIGMHPDWVEAAAFAWLARQTLEQLAGNAPVVTGAAGPRILGGIFPGNTILKV
ncbi:MAG: anhydro-N-acetylmuramic acid kinase [Halioglobus sp.]